MAICDGRSPGATPTSSTPSRPTPAPTCRDSSSTPTTPTRSARLAASTKLVISTVGPYALYGSKLVAAVAEAGVDYCDLTGELQWMRRMIDRYQDRAAETGARIVHACGFDSVPSDLGVWFTQREAIARFGEPCVGDQHGGEGRKGRRQRRHDRIDA